MPIYEFLCIDCHHYEEMILKVGETRPCPKCGSDQFQKLISSFATPALSSKTNKQISHRANHVGPQIPDHDHHHHHDSHDHPNHSKEGSCGTTSCRSDYVDKLIKKYDKSKGYGA